MSEAPVNPQAQGTHGRVGVGCIMAMLAVATLVSAGSLKLVIWLTQNPALEIREVLDQQVESWNGGDLDGFMTGYWNSDDLTFFSGGTVTKGWKPTLERYRNRYQADGKEMGKLMFADLDVQPIGTDAAFVRGRWKVVMSMDAHEGLFTLLFRKIDGKWVIVHDHTSAADPPKPNP